jgi:type IV pilus biogenesis protein CpaD/CtpE
MRAAILVLALALALAGCSAKAPVAVGCSPPTVYLQDVPEPVLRGRTNKDLAEHVLELREALRRSNLDKLNLRDWMDGQWAPERQ